jgi:hypothetical protein
MLRRVLLLAVLTWHSTEQFRLVFERSVNVINLNCLDEAGQAINLVVNTSVRFYLNRTDGIQSILMRSGTGATFVINPALEGDYSCGTEDSLVTLSQPEPLIGEFDVTQFDMCLIRDCDLIINFSPTLNGWLSSER